MWEAPLTRPSLLLYISILIVKCTTKFRPKRISVNIFLLIALCIPLIINALQSTLFPSKSVKYQRLSVFNVTCQGLSQRHNRKFKFKRFYPPKSPENNPAGGICVFFFLIMRINLTKKSAIHRDKFCLQEKLGKLAVSSSFPLSNTTINFNSSSSFSVYLQ